ncbi:MAG: hypothetical protein AAFO74_03455 [Pseudomonadota bacterium]
MEKTEKGAWIIHHGRKVSGVTGGAAHYSAIDTAAKAAALLARMSASEQAVIPKKQVEALARVGGLNPKTELSYCLQQLQQQAVISVGESGDVEVLGVTSHSALGHASDLFERSDPNAYERASIELGEIASREPTLETDAAEYISDICELTADDTAEFLNQARSFGFVDHEGHNEDRLLFNGNMFRKNSIQKTKKVLDSLSSEDATRLTDFSAKLNEAGALPQEEAEQILGKSLMSKLRAAAVFDESVVANSSGEFTFVTAPGAFHKFISPIEDDAFDQAKALVAALKYGMSISSETRGRIMAVSALLNKLLQGREVGPAPAIGQDYRALEMEGVVQIRNQGRYCYMRLRKMDVGQIALKVLTEGDASPVVLDKLPGAAVNRIDAPEQLRFDFRQKKQSEMSKKQTEELLRAMRSGGSL